MERTSHNLEMQSVLKTRARRFVDRLKGQGLQELGYIKSVTLCIIIDHYHFSYLFLTVLEVLTFQGRTLYDSVKDTKHCQLSKAIQVLPDELQEVGLKKGEFSETLVAKMSKEPQPPLGGVFGNEHFGDLADIEDPMEEDIDVPE